MNSVWFNPQGGGRFERDFSNDNLLPLVSPPIVQAPKTGLVALLKPSAPVTVTTSATTTSTLPTYYDYEYEYDTLDAAGQVVNRAQGVFRVTPEAKLFLTHVNTTLPTVVTFFADASTRAQRMELNWSAPSGAAGSASIALGADGRFHWDASALVSAGTTSINYTYRLIDAAGNPALDLLGQPIVVQGAASLGAAATDTEAPSTHYEITGLQDTAAAIHRAQTHNAFGDVDTETDGRGNTTNLAYNTLGALTQRLDPLTDITGENGVTTRARPDTRYATDRTGKAVSTLDANGNRSSQRWNAVGTGKLIGYDAAGQRKTANYLDGADTIDEAYSYTADGYLQDTRISRNGSSAGGSHRSNDLTGRVIGYSETNAAGNQARLLSSALLYRLRIATGLARTAGSDNACSSRGTIVSRCPLEGLRDPVPLAASRSPSRMGMASGKLPSS